MHQKTQLHRVSSASKLISTSATLVAKTLTIRISPTTRSLSTTRTPSTLRTSQSLTQLATQNISQTQTCRSTLRRSQTIPPAMTSPTVRQVSEHRRLRTQERGGIERTRTAKSKSALQAETLHSQEASLKGLLDASLVRDHSSARINPLRCIITQELRTTLMMFTVKVAWVETSDHPGSGLVSLRETLMSSPCRVTCLAPPNLQQDISWRT